MEQCINVNCTGYVKSSASKEGPRSAENYDVCSGHDSDQLEGGGLKDMVP